METTSAVAFSNILGKWVKSTFPKSDSTGFQQAKGNKYTNHKSYKCVFSCNHSLSPPASKGMNLHQRCSRAHLWNEGESMSNHRLPSSYEFSRGSKLEISFSLQNVILSGIFGTKSCNQRSIAKAVASSTKWRDWARQNHVYDIVMHHHGLSQEENRCINCDLGPESTQNPPSFQRMA